jgi:hypothetical protein
VSQALTNSIVVLGGFALALTAACNRAAEPAPGPTPAPGAEAAGVPAAVPAALDATPVTALPADVSAAMDQLQGKLKERLMAELQKGGPAAAAEVCRSEAPVITAGLQSPGLKIGRTSHLLRNSASEAPAWAATWVKAQGGRKVAAGPKMAQVELPNGGKGYLRVIGTAPVCLTCHGAPEAMDPGLKSALAQGYPQDRATGFAENDVRGWFWAEVPAAGK